MGLFLAFSLVACHKEEKAVESVTHTAVKAEHQAQSTATERDQERAQLIHRADVDLFGLGRAI